ncbi:unnamed protein product, partial [Polarella glacialis]
VGGQSVLRISGGAVFCDMKLLGSLGSRPGRAAERKVLVRARTRCDGIAIAPNALLAARRSFPSEVARLVQVEQLQRHFELRVESASRCGLVFASSGAGGSSVGSGASPG